MFYSDASSNCNGHNNDVGMACTPIQSGYYTIIQSLILISNSCLVDNCVEGSVRLVGSQSNNEGRLEICFNREWGNVCDNTFGIYDGLVVCKQLGYTNGELMNITIEAVL